MAGQFFQAGGVWYFRNANGNVAAGVHPSAADKARAVPAPAGFHPPSTIAAHTAPPGVKTPAPPAPADPAQTVAPPSAPGPFVGDTGYLVDRNNADTAYNDATLAPKQELARLTVTDQYGRNAFDQHAAQLQQQTDHSQYASNANLASRGVYQSGGRVQADNEIRDSNDQQRFALTQQYGLTGDGSRGAQLGEQIAGAGSDQTRAYGSATMLSTDRTRVDPVAQMAATPIAPQAAPLPGAVPKPATAKGFYVSGGKTYYQNTHGGTALAAKAPVKGKNTFLTTSQIAKR